MVEEAYLPIVFSSPKEEDNLKKIEIFGASAKHSKSGGYQVSEHSRNFLHDCIAKALFKENRSLSKYSFESLKIWLYDTQTPLESQGYSIPDSHKTAFKLHSHLEASELKYISIMDVGLLGNQQKLWTTGCEELLKPMFSRFIAPPDPPAVLKDFLAIRFGTELSTRLDLYLSMRKNMWFDALIIEAK